MSFQNEQIRDWAQAELYAAGSRLAARAAFVQRLTGSQKDLPILWQHSWDNPAIGDHWIEYPGYSKSGRLPKDYRQVATLSVERALLDTVTETLHGKQAVAYLLGKNAVMVGTTPEGALFGTDPDDESRYVIGMRVGKGVLRALPGVQSPELGFVPVIDPISQGHVVPIEQARGPIV